MPVLITALNEDTAFELDVVLDRRRLVSVAIVEGDLRLLGADRYFASTFRADDRLGSFPRVSSRMRSRRRSKTLTTDSNNSCRALERARIHVSGGGREYEYGIPAVFSDAVPA